MTTTATTEATVRLLSLDLPGNRRLHLALTMAADGTPGDVTIGCAFASESPLRALAEGPCIPAEAMPALRDALATLVDNEAA